MAKINVPEWVPDPSLPGYLYVRLADHIEAEIAAGVYPPGAMLPNEREMVAQYGVSIDTVRRAVATLNEREAATTYPSRGTYVNAPKPG